MKTKIATFLFLLAIFEGCANRELQPLTLPDFTYRLKRQQLQGQPIPIPLITPYDDDQQLRAAFIEGFRKGWNITLEYWLGNPIAIPEAYQNSTKLEKAWRDGYDAGQWALYRRVRPRSLDEEALVKSSYSNENSASKLKQFGHMIQSGNAKAGELVLLRIAELETLTPRHMQSNFDASIVDSVTRRKSFFYSEALKLNTNSLEALYGICTTSMDSDAETWCERWKSIDPNNALACYLKSFHMLERSRTNSLREIADGNSRDGIIHRPLYERLGDKLLDSARQNAMTQWRTSLDHPSTRLIRLQQVLMTNDLDAKNLLNLLIFDNKISTSIPITGSDLVLGCSMGIDILRSAAITNIFSMSEIYAEIAIRRSILQSIKKERSSAGILNEAVQILTANTEVLVRRLHSL